MTRFEHAPADWSTLTADNLAYWFCENGLLLTHKQALAYVLRDIKGVSRQEAADRMAIAPSTLDDRLGEARRKIEDARDTIELDDQIEADHRQQRRRPDKCSDCGETIAGRWVEDEDGTVHCPSCVAIDGFEGES